MTFCDVTNLFGNELSSFRTLKFRRPMFRLQVKSAYLSVLCVRCVKQSQNCDLSKKFLMFYETCAFMVPDNVL